MAERSLIVLLFTLLCQHQRCVVTALNAGEEQAALLHRRLDDRTDDASERDAYELVAFLLWYIFLVLCCVVPTCCAYRRRRLVEQRMAAQQENFARMQESNFFFLSTLTSRRDGEVVQAERSRILTDALKDTTMTVKETDLETLPPSERPKWTHGEIVAMHGGPEEENGAEARNNEYDIEETDHLKVLELPQNCPNGNRKVPGVCAICLCAYETGDVVAWSAEATCLHAFHNDCLVPWLAKKNEPHCPVCRQAFCKVNYNENETTSIYDSPFTFSQSFSQALARARLEASLMSRMESGGLDRDLEIVHVQNGSASGSGGSSLRNSSWITAPSAISALGPTPVIESTNANADPLRSVANENSTASQNPSTTDVEESTPTESNPTTEESVPAISTETTPEATAASTPAAESSSSSPPAPAAAASSVVDEEKA